MKKEKILRRIKRKKRIADKVYGTQGKPRVSVFRSNKHVFAQIINDEKGETLVSVSDLEIDKKSKEKKPDKGSTKSETAFLVGELLAKKALKKKIVNVAFDREGFKYHGRIKSLAEGLRKGGLKF